MVNKRLSLTTGEKETIKLLHADGKTYHAISKEVGRSPHTIKKYLSEPQAIVEVGEKKQELATMYENLAWRMIDSIKDKDIKAINAYQRTLSAAVATDKARLLKGESTENLNIRNLSVSILEIIRACEDKLPTMRRALE